MLIYSTIYAQNSHKHADVILEWSLSPSKIWGITMRNRQSTTVGTPLPIKYLTKALIQVNTVAYFIEVSLVSYHIAAKSRPGYYYKNQRSQKVTVNKHHSKMLAGDLQKKIEAFSENLKFIRLTAELLAFCKQITLVNLVT